MIRPNRPGAGGFRSVGHARHPPCPPQPLLSAYMAEACGGCDLQLNVCLFYVGEPRMDTAPPACYASRTDTAAAYRQVTWAAGGRFHWFGDTGA